MDMHKMETLYDKLCKEFDNVAEKELSANMLDAIHKLTGTIHYLDEMMEADDEYSERGSYRGGRSYRDGYNDDSYRRGQRRDGMGRYSREYSRTGDFRSELEAMMRDAPDERTREAMRQMMQNMG